MDDFPGSMYPGHDMLKAIARRIPGFAALNARLKARQVKHEYAELVQLYRGVVPCRLPLPRLTVPPRVLFIGTDEQEDRSGLIQALERAAPLSIFTQEDGRYGHNDFRAPDIRREANGTRLDRILDQLGRNGELPHLIIAQTWATLMDPAPFDRARTCGCLVVNIAMDDRHQFRGRRENGYWAGTLGLIGHIDLALTAAPECVEWYEKEGCPALYFPEASDPSIFRPMPELKKVHDVSFVGGRYGIRERIVNSLRRAGVRVSTYGSDWVEGRIATEDVPALFAQSKIVLGVGTIGHCDDFYALKLRDFDAPMSGTCYLTHDNHDLHGLYDVGTEIAAYSSVDDCVEQVRSLLADDSRRESIATAGRARATRDHTWDRRFSELFLRLSA